MIELTSARIRLFLRHQAIGFGERLRDRDYFLWLLATIPLVVLAPVAALVLSVWPSLRPNAQSSQLRGKPDLMVLLVATCNIVLSIVFWKWVGNHLLSLSPVGTWFFHLFGLGQSIAI